MTLDIGYLLPSDRSIRAADVGRRLQSNVHGPAHYNIRPDLGTDKPAFTIYDKVPEVVWMHVPGPGHYMPRYNDTVEVKRGVHPLTYQKIRTDWLRDVDLSGGPKEYLGYLPEPVIPDRRRKAATPNRHPYPYKYLNKKKKRDATKECEEFYRTLRPARPSSVSVRPRAFSSADLGIDYGYAASRGSSAMSISQDNISTGYSVSDDGSVARPRPPRSRSLSSTMVLKRTPFTSQDLDQYNSHNAVMGSGPVADRVAEIPHVVDPYKTLLYEHETPIGNLRSSCYENHKNVGDLSGFADGVPLSRTRAPARAPRTPKNNYFLGRTSTFSDMAPRNRPARRKMSHGSISSSPSPGRNSPGVNPFRTPGRSRKYSGFTSLAPTGTGSVTSDLSVAEDLDASQGSEHLSVSASESDLGLSSSMRRNERLSGFTATADRSRMTSTLEMSEFGKSHMGSTQLHAKFSIGSRKTSPKYRFTLTDNNKHENVEYDYSTDVIKVNNRRKRLSSFDGVTSDLSKTIGAGELYRTYRGPRFTFYTKKKSEQSVIHF